ncbi:hypothetical protein [Amycolatopsis sp. NPDC051372]|uniref:hypothetical protein n=1 Tax=Amycolatopsis sp. NPDC051372 TaxID=3155669 RepID=UPI00344306DD
MIFESGLAFVLPGSSVSSQACPRRRLSGRSSMLARLYSEPAAALAHSPVRGSVGRSPRAAACSLDCQSVRWWAGGPLSVQLPDRSHVCFSAAPFGARRCRPAPVPHELPDPIGLVHLDLILRVDRTSEACWNELQLWRFT